MCGISVTINGTLCDTIKMGNAIKHRGIEHNVTEIDNVRVAFSWLPIVNDKVQMQPFTSGKFKVFLNGYISNYLELAYKYKLNVRTDTDLVAQLFGYYGYPDVNELNGFFSIVCYDTEEKRLYTLVDRYGIKQLYKYESNGTVYISSEVKGILAVVKPELDPEAVSDWYYSLGVMTDNTIYKGIEKIKPDWYTPPQRETLKISYKKAKAELKRLWEQSIERNKATIPDGVLLSGGIDSGIIANYINPDYCFSMDYTDGAYSEIDNIKLNSKGKHYTMICNDKLFDEYKHKTVEALCDPRVGSCHTNFAITELASKFCKVIYSGAGGDELFFGYSHRYNKDINSVIRRTPSLSGQSYDITHEEYDWRFLKGILVVEDRMAGWHTIEARYPFLDNDFVDFVLSLPPEYRKNKRILKDISGLPKKVIKGKKRGFSNPQVTNEEWSNFVLDETRSLYNLL